MRVAAARDALVDDGWEVDVEGEVTRTGQQEPEAWVDLGRDDGRLTLRRSALEGTDTTTRVPEDPEDLEDLEDLEEVVRVGPGGQG